MSPAIRLALALALIGLPACDRGDERPPAEAKAQPDDRRPANTPAADPGAGEVPITITPPSSKARARPGASPAANEEIPSPAAGQSLADCLKNCAAAELSPDNHATCRLLCEGRHEDTQAKAKAERAAPEVQRPSTDE